MQQARVRSPQAKQPVTAIRGGSEARVRFPCGERPRRVGQQFRGDLRGVHPDEHHGQSFHAAGIREGGGEPLV
jgi:hypothetical protein